jgi:glucose-1-phosphate cytidylyltransferase
MKTVILAGGLGTRLSEETSLRPKPMIEVGGRPVLWHIMKIYSSYGINDFIVCCGYKSYVIKEYFANYSLHLSDVRFNMRENKIEVLEKRSEPWTVTLVETGDQTMTGGRLRRVRSYLEDDDAFCFTYGDGVCDVNISNLVTFHKLHGKLATVTAVRPLARYGALVLDGKRVDRFEEKPAEEGGLINGGFFVLSPKVINYIDGDSSVWERGPMESLARDGQMMAYVHNGFWQAMDTMRDRQFLESLWAGGLAPWCNWNEGRK